MTETYLLRDAYGISLLKINNSAPFMSNFLEKNENKWHGLPNLTSAANAKEWLTEINI